MNSYQAVFLRIYVVMVGDVIATNHCLVLAEINGCQVGKSFVGN